MCINCVCSCVGFWKYIYINWRIWCWVDRLIINIDVFMMVRHHVNIYIIVYWFVLCMEIQNTCHVHIFCFFIHWFTELHLHFFCYIIIFYIIICIEYVIYVCFILSYPIVFYKNEWMSHVFVTFSIFINWKTVCQKNIIWQIYENKKI